MSTEINKVKAPIIAPDKPIVVKKRKRDTPNETADDDSTGVAVTPPQDIEHKKKRKKHRTKLRKIDEGEDTSHAKEKKTKLSSALTLHLILTFPAPDWSESVVIPASKNVAHDVEMSDTPTRPAIVYPPFERVFLRQIKQTIENGEKEKDSSGQNEHEKEHTSTVKWLAKDGKFLDLEGDEENSQTLHGLSPPITSFSDERLPQSILEFQNFKGLVTPTPIQQECWPIVLSGYDLLGISQTGSIPHILASSQRQSTTNSASSSSTTTTPSPSSSQIAPSADTLIGPTVLILVPTRELAIQVWKETKPLFKIFNIKSCVLYGGEEKQEQKFRLTQKYDIIVATPGRLVDLLSDPECILTLSTTTYFVMDEADKMFQMGLYPQVKKIAEQIRPDRQTLFFSATFPEVLQGKLKEWMSGTTGAVMVKIVTKVDVGIVDEGISEISSTIVQRVEVCAAHKKPRKLIRFLEKVREEEKAKRQKSAMLIFVNKIATVSFLVQFLKKNNFSADGLSGKLRQQDRDATMQAFKSGKTQILVATDVAARGLHINKLPYVINYDFPSNLKQYIHRVGRTGRNGASGFSFSFFTRNLAALAPDLIQFLEEHKQPVDQHLKQLID